LASAWLSAGCAVTKLTYTSAELKAELQLRAPSTDPADAVMPFEVDNQSVDIAFNAIAGHQLPRERVRALAESLFDKQFFGIRYSEDATRTAMETLRSREGNCMSIASAFVGLARALGMQAYFVDISTQVSELERQSQMAVRMGHITAFVEVDHERLALDVARDVPVLKDYRILSDVEAVGHFYNNRGFERIGRAKAEQKPVDWWPVLMDFQRAIAVFPGFAQAWNNAGIAWSHLGEPDRALVAFQEAIGLDPNLAAPHNNLGLLLSQRGEHLAALQSYREAVELEPKSAHVRFNFGVALERHGESAAALEQIRAALFIDPSHQAARAMQRELLGLSGLAPLPTAAVVDPSAPDQPQRKVRRLKLGAGVPLLQ
jgi:tetratricopeptide (TPR) repeat protein